MMTHSVSGMPAHLWHSTHILKLFLLSPLVLHHLSVHAVLILLLVIVLLSEVLVHMFVTFLLLLFEFLALNLG